MRPSLSPSHLIGSEISARWTFEPFSPNRSPWGRFLTSFVRPLSRGAPTYCTVIEYLRSLFPSPLMPDPLPPSHLALPLKLPLNLPLKLPSMFSVSLSYS